jgi:hypothetical protein
MAGNSGEVRKVRISSLSAFLVLGAVSATDVKTSFYYDYSRPGTQLASGPVEDGIDLASEGRKTSRVATDDFMMAQLGQGKIFSEIRQGLRELTSLDRCWRNGEERDDLLGNVARLCTALREPL